MKYQVQCNLCGKYADELVTSVIEGAEIDVCPGCSKLGKIVKRLVKPSEKVNIQLSRKPVPVEEIIEDIVDDYASKIKNARESRGLKQEELARKLAEKSTLIHKIESGHMKPSIEFAKKLEKALNLVLIETKKSLLSGKKTAVSAKEGMTIGDLIKIR